MRAFFLMLVFAVSQATATPPIPAGPARGEPDSAGRHPPVYPPARRGGTVDVFHGVEVRDPYRWMEDLGSPELAAWIQAQNTLSAPELRKDAFHAAILAKMQALSDLYPNEEPATEAGGRQFYRALVDERVVLMVREPGGAAPRALVDAAALGADGAVKAFVPSPDGRRVAYVVGPGGADWGEIRFHDVDANQGLPAVLPNVRLEGPMHWTADGTGLAYRRFAPASDGKREAPAKDPAIYLHRLGSPVDADSRIFSLPADRQDWALSFNLPGDRRHLFAYVERGPWHEGNLGGSRTQVSVIALDPSGRPEQGVAPSVMTEPDAAYRVLHVANGQALVFTDKGAPRRRLVSMGVGSMEPPEAWRDIVPEGPGVLTEVRWIGGRIVAHAMEDVKSAVRVYAIDGREVAAVPLPGAGIVQEIHGSPDSPHLRLLYSGLLQAPAFIRHDLASGDTSVTRVAASAPDLSAFEVRQEWFTSRDGTRVPMFVLARRDLVRDGSHPTILSGYGASSTSELPLFREEAVAWLQSGGVYAIANLRGGGEFGRDWYQAAIRERKQTTFDDMIAAAEHLVAGGWTSPRRLAIRGASNGGLLVTAVMLQRPDLMGAVLADVPVTDMMRLHLAANGAQQVEQWGSPDDPVVFPAMRAYSPVHNVVAGTCYPPTWISTSHDDQRLPAWHAYKFTAALQAGQGCDSPILLHSRASGGHGGGSLSEWMENVALELAFAARHLGLPSGR